MAPQIHPHSVLHLLLELGRNRFKLRSQYINFWGCPLPCPNPLITPASYSSPSQLQERHQWPGGCLVASTH